jgi:hypothetical protein
MSSLADAFNTVAVQEDPSEVALQRLNVIYTKRDDGRLLVETTLDFRDRDMKEFPDLSNVVVQGDFLFGMNELTSLKGAPYSVSGDFRGALNWLKDLQHMPRYIGGVADFSGNRLRSIRGAEDAEVGILNVTGNPGLKDLENPPKAFMELQSDMGTFKTADDIPAQLRISETTRARIRATADSMTGLTRAVIAPKTASFRRKS